MEKNDKVENTLTASPVQHEARQTSTSARHPEKQRDIVEVQTWKEIGQGTSDETKGQWRPGGLRAYQQEVQLASRVCILAASRGSSFQVFREGIETAVHAFDGGEAIFASKVFMEGSKVEVSLHEPIHNGEPRVSNTTYVAGENLDFRGPEGCCQV
ncbi:hypothetical protein BKA93DRAFT_753696 [Sparassis latifolia]